MLYFPEICEKIEKKEMIVHRAMKNPTRSFFEHWTEYNSYIVATQKSQQSLRVRKLGTMLHQGIDFTWKRQNRHLYRSLSDSFPLDASALHCARFARFARDPLRACFVAWSAPLQTQNSFFHMPKKGQSAVRDRQEGSRVGWSKVIATAWMDPVASRTPILLL